MQPRHPRTQTDVRRLALTSALVAVAAHAAGAQPPRPRTMRADVTIHVSDSGRAHVRAQYDFAGNPGALSFELLQTRCAEIGPVEARSGTAAVALATETTGPWLRWHDTSAVDPARVAIGYSLAYDVELRARDVSIPVVLPLAVLRGRARGDPVASFAVRLPPAARVTLPRMSRDPAGRWTARVVALPAALRVSGLNVPNAECSPGVRHASGRFKVIFWALVATLALWVPTYLWWANRQRQT